MEQRENMYGMPKVFIKMVADGADSPDSIVGDDPKPDDDFYGPWDKFLAKSSNRSSSISTLAKRVAKTERAARRDDNGLRSHESPAKSYEEAKAECKAKVRAIVTECRRLNQKYIDRHFDLENQERDCIHPLGNSSYEDDSPKPSAVKRIEDIFEKPQFNEDRASASDVIQGQLGDCWLLAALMSLAAKPGLIKRLCVDRDEEVGVYGFVFFRDGAWVPEVIDDRLFLHVADGEDLFVGKFVDTSTFRTKEISTSTNSYDINKLRENLQKGGEALFFSRCKENSDTWLPLIEKAYAKAHGDYGSTEGGDTSEGIEDLTGGVSVCIRPSHILDKKIFWEELKGANDTYLFAGGAKHYDRGGKTSQHAYAVLQVAEHGDMKLLKLRDPWGKHQDDGPWMHKFTEWTSDLVDKLEYNFKDPGVFWMTYENFLRHFYIIDRTRLFTDDWKVSQQWTSVNVPPIAEYLDTQFVLTLTEKGPVVLVLCQPDTRYFRGLEGRYEYSLHFRVYDTKDTSTYLTRSMLGSGCLPKGLRSVTADLELPAGTYSILVKVTPERLTFRTAAGQIVDEYKDRKEKLLRAGRNFDLAHAKGKRRDKEGENKARKREEQRRRRTREMVRGRKLRQELKNKERKRLQRVEGEKARRKDLAFWKEMTDKAASQGYVLPPQIPDVKGTPPPDPTAEIGDDDFEWDHDIDGFVSMEEESENEESDMYKDDPWNAVCVLGLRVYSLNGDANIIVEEGEYHPAEDKAIQDQDRVSDSEDQKSEEPKQKEEQSEESKQNGQESEDPKREGLVKLGEHPEEQPPEGGIYDETGGTSTKDNSDDSTESTSDNDKTPTSTTEDEAENRPSTTEGAPSITLDLRGRVAVHDNTTEEDQVASEAVIEVQTQEERSSEDDKHSPSCWKGV